MKPANSGKKRFSKAFIEATIAAAPAHGNDPDCPYDPNDPKAVKAYLKDAVVTKGGGVKAVREALAEKRRIGQRGPQKAATKEVVTLRLDRIVLSHFRATGAGWQTRMNDALKRVVARQSKPAKTSA